MTVSHCPLVFLEKVQYLVRPNFNWKWSLIMVACLKSNFKWTFRYFHQSIFYCLGLYSMMEAVNQRTSVFCQTCLASNATFSDDSLVSRRSQHALLRKMWDLSVAISVSISIALHFSKALHHWFRNSLLSTCWNSLSFSRWWNFNCPALFLLS